MLWVMLFAVVMCSLAVLVFFARWFFKLPLRRLLPMWKGGVWSLNDVTLLTDMNFLSWADQSGVAWVKYERDSEKGKFLLRLHEPHQCMDPMDAGEAFQVYWHPLYGDPNGKRAIRVYSLPAYHTPERKAFSQIPD